MPDTVFLIAEDGSLHAMPQSEYVRESVLQDLLARYPLLLSRGGDEARRFLLVKREMGVPDAGDAGTLADHTCSV